MASNQNQSNQSPTSRFARVGTPAPAFHTSGSRDAGKSQPIPNPDGKILHTQAKSNQQVPAELQSKPMQPVARNKIQETITKQNIKTPSYQLPNASPNNLGKEISPPKKTTPNIASPNVYNQTIVQPESRTTNPGSRIKTPPALRSAQAGTPAPAFHTSGSRNAAQPLTTTGREISPPNIVNPDVYKPTLAQPKIQETRNKIQKISNSQTPATSLHSSDLKHSELDAIAKSANKSPLSTRLIWTLVIIGVLLLGAIYWFFLANKTTLIAVNPKDAEVKVDNNTVAANEKIRLKTGNHNLTISRSGYVEYKKDISINRWKFVNVFEISLKKIPSPAQAFDMDCTILAQNADGIFCLGNSGKAIYQIIAGNGKEAKKAVTPTSLAGIVQIIFNPKESLAIFKIKADSATLTNSPFNSQTSDANTESTWLYDFNRYNLVDQEATLWGADIGDVVWTPDGQNAYYTKTTGEAYSLIKVGKNNQNPEIIFDLKALGIENPRLTISGDGKSILMVPRATDFNKNYVYSFDTYSKKTTPLTSKGNNLGAKYSIDSKSMIFTRYKENTQNQDANSEAYIYGSKDSDTDTQIRATIDNVVWKNNTSFIALKSYAKNETPQMVVFDIDKRETTDVMWDKTAVSVMHQYLFDPQGQKIYYIGKDGLLYSLEMVLNKY